MLTNFFTLAAGLAATAAAFDCNGPYFSFYNRGGPAMSIQRLDPALFPGQQSPHLHSFDGGNGLAADMSFADTQSSSCTTARVKPDKSLYWRPTLFWNGNNTGFYRVPEKFLKIYYKFGDAGNVRANVTDFPENFQMMAGDPFKRAEGDNPASISWACLGENYSRINSKGFPTGFTSCKEGLTTEITFPSCWNGNALDPKKPSAHMAWPTNNAAKGIEACPEGFRTARFPTIFIEFWYDVSAFNGQYGANDMPWVLSNGDKTGYGFHADFRNGWKKGVLAKAIAPTDYCNCGCGCGNDQMKKCFGADNVNADSDAGFKSCAAKAAFPGDDIPVLQKLPGCNPLSKGPARAVPVTGPDCAASAASGASKSSVVSSVVSSAVASSISTSSATLVKASAAAAATTVTPAGAKTSAFPTLSISLAGKGLAHETKAEEEDASTAAKSSSKVSEDKPTAFPSLTLVSSGVSTAGPTAPAGGDDDEECVAPTTITITPTVYVTAAPAGYNATSCDSGTVYATVTNTATVTIRADSYIKHKRHSHGHMHHMH